MKSAPKTPSAKMEETRKNPTHGDQKMRARPGTTEKHAPHGTSNGKPLQYSGVTHTLTQPDTC